MRPLILFLILAALSAPTEAQIPDLRRLTPDEAVIRDDLGRILNAADLAGKVDFVRTVSPTNTATVTCTADKVIINVQADDEAWGQTFYMAVQRLGFLFPHPRIQISPTLARVRDGCGEIMHWRPALKYAGFHLHTLHPSEWVHGFLLGKTEIANQTVRWLARNQQNVFDLSLLRQNRKTIWKNLGPPFALAKSFGIHTGVTIGFALHQQNSYKLVSLLGTFSTSLSTREITAGLITILNNVDLSFINFEMGTSEFTPTNYPRMLHWMNFAGAILKTRGVAMLTKVHVTINQKKEPWGNFNFLPHFANPGVGILPHTVYLYGLGDDRAPMYGNTNFRHILNFMVQEKANRRAWFYPETSYFIALDIDTGLLLTDYLNTRASDMRILYENGIEGQLNFTTGQEMGYWLMDWTVALLNNLDYNFDPLVGIKLLEEDEESWRRILAFQNEFFKEKHLLGIVTFQNFGDEVEGSTHMTLERNPLKVLNRRPDLLRKEIDQLNEAIAAFPQDLTIRNDELRLMMEITELRMHHALKTREAFLNNDQMSEYLAEAVRIRGEAQERINRIKSHHARYPEAKIWERHKNPTAYPWGYAFGVSSLHYWRREEEVIRTKNFSPFFMNIFDWWDIMTVYGPGA